MLSHVSALAADADSYDSFHFDENQRTPDSKGRPS